MNKYTLYFIAACIIGAVLYFIFNPDLFVPQASNTTTNYILPVQVNNSANFTNVLAIDIGDDKDFSPEQVTTGHDVILLLHKEGGQDTAYHANDVINGVDLLAELDSDNNGRIDINDPFFSKLEVLRMTANGSRKVITKATDAGIRAIFLYDKETINSNTITNNMMPVVVGYVVMSDGSHRQIHVVSIDSQYLQ